MRMVRWICVKDKGEDKVTSKELRETRIDDIISVQQNRLQWYGHVVQKDDND